LNYILPVYVTSTVVVGSLAAAMVLYGLYSAVLRKAPVRALVSGLPSLMVVLILGELIACSLARKYPFGGLERQQSIFFPFFVLAAFVLLDQLVSLLSTRWAQVMALSAVALLIAATFGYRWQKTPRHSEELFADQYQTFLRNVSPVGTIYVDQFSLIGYYIHNHDLKWKFYRHFLEPDRVDEYRLIDRHGQQVLLLRDIDQWNLDLRNPSVYRVLSRSIHDAQLTGITVFLLKQVAGSASPPEIAAEKNQVAKLAADAGLQVTSIYDDNAEAGITVTLLPGRT
jgi:hypothetical protein